VVAIVGLIAAVALGLAAYLRFGRRELHDPKLVEKKLQRDACRAQLRLAVIAPAGAARADVQARLIDSLPPTGRSKQDQAVAAPHLRYGAWRALRVLETCAHAGGRVRRAREPQRTEFGVPAACEAPARWTR
jgi:hypothetical protein